MQIILASKSPRRKEILSMLGVDFQVITEETDENSLTQDAFALVCELALCKGQAVLSKIINNKTLGDNTLIISADTVVVSPDGKHIYGKPKTRAEAHAMMADYSGKTHSVVSGLAVFYRGVFHTGYEISYVSFDNMRDSDIDFYVDSCEPYDKAGGYAVQGLASLYINKIQGDYFNIVGLPVHLLKTILENKFAIDTKQIFNIKESPTWVL
jgi:septum formation protein